MTIRQYLKRRSDRYASLAVAFLLAVGIAMGYAPRILAIRIVFAVLVAVVLAAAFWSLFEIPCPNCGKRLASVGFWVSVGRVSSVAEHCPHCGIGIDADMPGGSKAGAER
jgi:peptidoglycan/LPS O-acetylase OafA/YrhL